MLKLGIVPEDFITCTKVGVEQIIILIKTCEFRFTGKKHVGKYRRKSTYARTNVTIKYVRTVKKEMMNFGTFLDFGGEFFDTVHFSNSLKYYPFRGYGVYLLRGKIVEEFGYPSLEVEKMAKLPVKSDPRG